MNLLHVFFYLTASILFIVALRSLSSPKTARTGNILGMTGMLIALVSSLSFHSSHDIYILLALAIGAFIGILLALKINIKALPEMIAVFNGLGGAAAMLVSLAEIAENHADYIQNSIGLIIGALAFSGSVIAFLKLHNIINPKPFVFFGQHIINLVLIICIALLGISLYFQPSTSIFYLIGVLAIILGILLVLPVGGADMPIIISILNAYSGLAAVGIGFVMDSVILVIVGSLVGASGIILSYIMTKSMNRSLLNVIGGNFIAEKAFSEEQTADKVAKQASPEDAAFILENSANIIIVVGYGLAVAQGQSILKKMADILEQKYGNNVRFAIHPVAGRMPGHMNVLLAEAGIDYEKVFALDEINNDFASTDATVVVGANDIVNPSAETNPQSSLYGMPVLEVWKSRTVFVIKRSLGSGYAGVENPLFFYDNTMMIFGDAKEVLEKITKALE